MSPSKIFEIIRLLMSITVRLVEQKITCLEYSSTFLSVNLIEKISLINRNSFSSLASYGTIMSSQKAKVQKLESLTRASSPFQILSR